MEIHRASPAPRLPPAALFPGAQIETGDPSLVPDRNPPAIRTESQRGTFFGRAFEDRFAAFPPPNNQPAIRVVMGEKAAIRAETERQHFHLKGHPLGFQTLEFAILWNRADADYAVPVKEKRPAIIDL
jgi:hypothetical protein